MPNDKLSEQARGALCAQMRQLPDFRVFSDILLPAAQSQNAGDRSQSKRPIRTAQGRRR